MKNECAPSIRKNKYKHRQTSRWRDGVVANLLKKGDKNNPGNYKVICKLPNDRIVGVLVFGKVRKVG